MSQNKGVFNTADISSNPPQGVLFMSLHVLRPCESFCTSPVMIPDTVSPRSHNCVRADEGTKVIFLRI